MIIDLIAIYRARKNRPLAARLAAKFAQGQALDRLTAPLFLVHLVLWLIIGIGSLLFLATLWLAVTWHGSALLPGLLPGGLAFLAFRIDFGLRKGMDRIKAAADSLTDRGMDKLLKQPPESEQVPNSEQVKG